MEVERSPVCVIATVNSISDAIHEEENDEYEVECNGYQLSSVETSKKWPANVN